MKNALTQLIAIVAIGMASIPFGQAQVLEWTKSMGGSGLDYGESMVVDSSGNVYTIGEFQGTVDFDPGVGTFNLVSSGDFDIFISKLDSSGNLLWAKKMGGFGFDRGMYISLDGTGNVCAVGFFKLIADFDPGPGIFNLTSAGNSDMFISKLDTSGNFIWAKRIGGTGEDRAISLALDAAGNVNVVGRFQQTVDFDPGPGIFNLSSAGDHDVSISKLSASGSFMWAIKMGNTAKDRGYGIAVDDFGYVYSVGSFQGTVDFDPGPGSHVLTPVSGEDVFIQKLDSSGNFVWAKGFGGTSDDQGYDITIDLVGNVLTTGRFRGTVDFDPGPGTFNLTGAGFDDVFISKLDGNGDFLWARSMGGSQDERGNSISTDSSGNVFTTGQFAGTVDFDPGAGTFNLTSAGGDDIFISKLDASGNFDWAKSMGAAGDDKGSEIFADDSDNIFITGDFRNTVDFDPGTNTVNLTSLGQSDLFIQKLAVCTSSFNRTDLINACDSYTWVDGLIYTASNSTATFTQINPSGCDSVFTLDLTIGYSNSGTDVITACNSYTWIDGVTYTTTNNTAAVTVSNSLGCDSLVSLALTILPSSSSVDTITACDSYTWIDGITYTADNSTSMFPLLNSAGCDSLISLDLTILPSSNETDVITACDSFTWIDGITYTSDNTSATVTLQNASGCDSIVTLELTLNEVDAGVLTEGTTLTANATAASYQWLDCNNGYTEISGETARSFTASVNGSFAVAVTENSCTDTSECVLISTVGIEHEAFFEGITVFPNPNQGQVNIDLGGLTSVSVKIFTMTGQLVYQKERIRDSVYQFEFNEASGIYILEVRSERKSQRYKLVRE